MQNLKSNISTFRLRVKLYLADTLRQRPVARQLTGKEAFYQTQLGFALHFNYRAELESAQLPQTVIGLTTRLIAKATSRLFKHILRLHLLWCGYSQFSTDTLIIQWYLLRICTKFI